ncbi:hypothetical protein ACFL6F_02795 [Planctomycetota bacterium]
MKRFITCICMYLGSIAILLAQEEEIKEAKSLIQYIKDKAPWSYVAIGTSVIVVAVFLNVLAKMLKGKPKDEQQ